MADIVKPLVGKPGWNAAVDAVIDKVNAHDANPILNANTTGAAVGKLFAVDDVSPLHAAVMEYFAVLAGNPDLLITGAVTRDSNGAATSAPVVWPDGRPGVYTATMVSTAFPGAVDAYTITYDAAGADPDLTYTQPAVTRNANGAVTARPGITVA